MTTQTMQKAKRKYHPEQAATTEKAALTNIKRGNTMRVVLDCIIAIGMVIVLGLLVYIFVAVPIYTGSLP